MGKKKKVVGGETNEDGVGNSISIPVSNYNDTISFISMSKELKDEGNKLFQKRDLEGAILKYQKALKLLPRNHIDVSYLRSNMASCYMQMGLVEYSRAIHECDLALEVMPNYSIAMLKRARCYEALNRLDLALRDVGTVVKMDPNNTMALEILERVKNALEEKGLRVNDTKIELPLDYVEPPNALPPEKAAKEKARKKKSNKEEEKPVNNKILEKNAEEKFEEMMKTDETIVVLEKKTSKSKKKKAKGKIDENEVDTKEIIEEKSNGRKKDVPKKTTKLIFGDDIRCTKLPVNCTLLQLREVICDKFASLGAVLVKYKDQEGDLVTITCDDELKWAEMGSHGSIRLYIVEATPQMDPLFEKHKANEGGICVNSAFENGCVRKVREINISSCIEDWIIHFAELFKNHVRFESDKYLDFHELGVKLSNEALDETVTSEEAQGLFDMAGDKFQEMAALALFNWGNVHMSRARKKAYFTEDSSQENLHEQIISSFEWTQKEYVKAGEKYEAAINMKSDFYEGFLALGQQQFEQAKLAWYHALISNVNLVAWPSTEVFQLYNKADDNMKKGMQMWGKSEERHRNKNSNSTNVGLNLQKMELDEVLENISSDEIATQEANMRSQINLQWGFMLYEKSITEFKLGLSTWHESLEVAVEKFELAGASPTDIAVLLKNHCSNNTAVDGMFFKIIIRLKLSRYNDTCS